MNQLEQAYLAGAELALEHCKLAYTSTFYQDPSTPKSTPPTSTLPVVSKSNQSVIDSTPSGPPNSNLPKFSSAEDFATRIKRAAETLTIPGLPKPELALPDPLIVEADKGNLASSMVQARAAKKKLQTIAAKVR